MFGSMTVARIRGIPVRLHVTLLAMCVISVVRFGWLGVPAAVVLFGSVLLHELGHALVAQRFGIGIASIDLHLLGGMALMKSMPRRPSHEALIAAAGPAVSMVLAALTGLLAIAFDARLDLGMPRPIDLLAYAAAVNLGMALFNLIPALPLDGGRIFRALLSSRLGNLKATNIAAWISRGFGLIFIAVGFYAQAWSLLLIGGLLFLMVRYEERLALVRETWGPHGSFQPAMSPLHETREEYVDAHGRRYVVLTRLR